MAGRIATHVVWMEIQDRIVGVEILCMSQHVYYATDKNAPTRRKKKLEAALRVPAKRKSARLTSKTGVYIGETSRSLYERSKEHITDAKNYSHKSHIIKHWKLSHQEENEIPPMSFKIKGIYRDCLSRQLGEAMKQERA